MLYLWLILVDFNCKLGCIIVKVIFTNIFFKKYKIFKVIYFLLNTFFVFLKEEDVFVNKISPSNIFEKAPI